jgi:hypothetical protein
MDGVKKYKIIVTLTEEMLASSPANPKVYEEFIAARGRKDAEDRGDEVGTLPASEIEKIGSSVFHRDDTGLFLFDYHVRGFFKEAASAVTGKGQLTAYKSKIDKFVFVFPRRLYLKNGSGESLKVPSGVTERPIRAMTAQGPRTTVKRSENVKVGTWFEATVEVLPLGQKEITEEMIRGWLDYGQYSGFGEWRSGSNGRFTFDLTAQ